EGLAQNAGDVEHFAAVGHDQLVARATVADIQVRTIAPDAGATDDGGVVVGPHLIADDPTAIRQHAAAVDDQRIENEVVADDVPEVDVVHPVADDVDGVGLVVAGELGAGG